MPGLLASLQAGAFGVLNAHCPCFVRLSHTHDCLFVSDLPSRVDPSTVSAAISSLDGLGLIARNDGALLRLDGTLPLYERLLQDHPTEPPPLPAEDRLHPAYALCCLLLLHPAPLERQPQEPLRQMLKLMETLDVRALLQAVGPLHAQCAEWLRKRLPLPFAAGQVLACLLAQLECGHGKK